MKTLKKHRKKTCIAAFSAMFLCAVAFQVFCIPKSVVQVDAATTSFFKQNASGVAKKLIAIDGRKLDNNQLLLVESLQGIVAKKQAQIYIIQSDNYEKWLEDLKANWGITYTMVKNNDPWELCKQFKSYVSDMGYVKCSTQSESCNAATTIAGQKNYLVVQTSQVAKANAAGFKMKIDATSLSVYQNVFSTYKSKLNKSLMFFQNYTNPAARDYGIQQGSLYVYPTDGSKYAPYLGILDKNSVLMGWHKDEISGVQAASKASAITLASDYSYNLSVFANLPRKTFTQKTTKDNSKTGKVHYVTFILSDGDNVQWYENGLPATLETLQEERFLLVGLSLLL